MKASHTFRALSSFLAEMQFLTMALIAKKKSRLPLHRSFSQVFFPKNCSEIIRLIGRTQASDAAASSSLPTGKGGARMRNQLKPQITRFVLIVCIVIEGLALTPRLIAIPAFARKYRTSCSTCHSNWPELNDFGRAFKINGFKFPKDDEEFVKDPPLMLGAQAQKEAFPYSLYPGELPILPIAFRYSGYFTHNTPQPAAVTAQSGFSPATVVFQPNTFTIIAAGSFGPSLSFWIDNDISAGGSGAAGGLGDGYLKANNPLGFLHVPLNTLNIRFGQFELDLPFTQARTVNLTGYAIFNQTAYVNPSGSGPLPGTTANPFAFSSPQTGVEIGGYPSHGNTWWSVTVTDGMNAAYGTSSAATGHDSKDVYVNLSQRFNLEKDLEARKEVQAAGKTGVRDHTSIRFNAFGYYGRNHLNQGGTLVPGFPEIVEPFYRAGGAFDYKFRSSLKVWGLFEHGRDTNKVLNQAGTTFVEGTPVTFSGGFLETEYWPYPWLIAIMRYDAVNSPTDRQNGVSRHNTRNLFEPQVDFVVRPNIKIEAQYTVSYEQPIPSSNSFYRANQLLAGIDFVF
jgi:hypothetical protein